MEAVKQNWKGVLLCFVLAIPCWYAGKVFPMLGGWLGFDTNSGTAFGIFAGTAVNDTSSVTATASTWDSMHGLGTQTLDEAVVVKLTRTLAIIPITLVLTIREARQTQEENSSFSLKRAFPLFILFFVLASLVTTLTTGLGLDADFFSPAKELSKFFIVMAMLAIGLGTDVVKLVKSGGKPLLLGLCCWVGIAATSYGVQSLIGLV